jgi:hypothetical protein
MAVWEWRGTCVLTATDSDLERQVLSRSGMSLRLGTPERRREFRGVASGEPSRFELVNMILGSYWEMPGLNLTLAQAARLFGVRPHTCAVVFEDMVRAGVLHLSDDRSYTLPPR